MRQQFLQSFISLLMISTSSLSMAMNEERSPDLGSSASRPVARQPLAPEHGPIVQSHAKRLSETEDTSKFKYFSFGRYEDANIQKEDHPFLVMTGRELLQQKKELTDFMKQTSGVSLLLDVTRGDGLVNADGVFTLGINHIPGVSSLSISNVEHNVISIDDGFLWEHEASIIWRKIGQLTHLDLSELNHLTSIGSCFLNTCNGLTQLRLPERSNIQKIQWGFLLGCYGLTQLDLSFLQNVTRIEGHFLDHCEGLTQLDLSPLGNVTSIGESFLGYCIWLTHLDLLPLSQMTTIDDYFLENCSGLKQLDLSPLRNVTSIGEGFLCSCDGLTQLDCSPLVNLRTIGIGFLRGCSGLARLDLSGLNQVKSLGCRDQKLYCCYGIREVVLSESPEKNLVQELVGSLRVHRIPEVQALAEELNEKYLLEVPDSD